MLDIPALEGHITVSTKRWSLQGLRILGFRSLGPLGFADLGFRTVQGLRILGKIFLYGPYTDMTVQVLAQFRSSPALAGNVPGPRLRKDAAGGKGEA